MAGPGMIMVPLDGDGKTVEVREGKKRIIGIVGSHSMYSTINNEIFTRLGLYESGQDCGELLADLEVSWNYVVDGDEAKVRLEGEIDLPTSSFDAREVLTENDVQPDLEDQGGDVEKLPDDPPTSIQGESST